MPRDYDKSLDDGQQLDIVEEQPEVEQQAPQEQNVSYAERKFSEDLDSFINKSNNAEEFFVFAKTGRVWLQSIPGAEPLAREWQAYGNRVNSTLLEMNKKRTEKRNKYIKLNEEEQAKEDAEFDRILTEAREGFRPIAEKIKKVMHENWSHPATDRFAERSRDKFLNNYTKKTSINLNNPSPKKNPVDVSAGDQQGNRQAAINEIYSFMETIQWGENDKYISPVDYPENKNDYYKKSYDGLTKSIVSGYSKEVKSRVPRYKPEIYGAYGSTEGIKNYCKALDNFFKECIPLGAAEGSKSIIRNARNRARKANENFNNIHEVNGTLNEISNILKNEKYSKEAKEMLATSFTEKLKEGPGNIIVSTPKDAGSLDSWFRRLTDRVKKSQAYPDVFKKFHNQLKDFCYDADKNLRANETDIAYSKQTEKLRQRTEMLKGTMKRNYSTEFQMFVYAMDDMVAEDNERGVAKASNRERAAACAVDYCIRKANQNKDSYDSMEATRLGSVIETLKEMDPERGKLMEDVFGMNVSMDGDKKSYSFRKIPADLLKRQGRGAVSLTSLERNITAYRNKMDVQPDLNRVAGVSKGLLKTVKDADPALMKSSEQYKAFRKAAQKLSDEVALAAKDMEAGKELSNEKKQQLSRHAKALSDTAKAYREYKQGPNLSKIAQKRILASQQATREAELIDDLLRAPEIRRAYKEDPVYATNSEIEHIKNTRDASPDNLAKLFVLSTVVKGLSDGMDPEKFKDVMSDPMKIRNQADKIKNSPEFKEMLKKNPEIKLGKPISEIGINAVNKAFHQAALDRKNANREANANKEAGKNKDKDMNMNNNAQRQASMG